MIFLMWFYMICLEKNNIIKYKKLYLSIVFTDFVINAFLICSVVICILVFLNNDMECTNATVSTEDLCFWDKFCVSGSKTGWNSCHLRLVLLQPFC